MKPILLVPLIAAGLSAACAGQRTVPEAGAPRAAAEPPAGAVSAATTPDAPVAAAGDHAGHAAMDDHTGHDVMTAADHTGMSPAAHAADPHAEHLAGLPATAGPGYTVADVRFMQMMIPHHEQALRMVALVPDRNASANLRTVALRIDISQRDEIALMEDWLRKRGQAIPTAEQKSGMVMAGLLTPEEFARLEAARGREFDRLFMEYMIGHHAGALTMVDDLFASPGAAQDPDIFRFVTDVGADQLDEIGLMERLLERLDSPERSEAR